MDMLVAMAASTIRMAALAGPACMARAGTDVSPGALRPPLATAAGDRVIFGLYRFDLKEKGRATLARDASRLSARPELAAVVAGHLGARGIAHQRLRKVPYGAGRPPDPPATDVAAPRDRGARLILIDLNSR